MFKAICLFSSLSAAFILAGCSNSSSSSDKESDPQLLGYWKGFSSDDPNAISLIEKNAFFLYTKDQAHNCLANIHFDALITTTTIGVVDGSKEMIRFPYEMTGENTAVSKNTDTGEEFSLTKASDSEIAELQSNLCSDSSLTGTLSVSIEFESLKKAIPIESVEEFSHFVNVWFDMDNSDDRSDGDLWMAHQIGLDSLDEPDVFDLEAIKVYLITANMSDGESSTSATGRATIENNTLTLTFERSAHKVFNQISNGTPVAINTVLAHTVDNIEQTSRDSYPDEVDDNKPVFTKGLDSSSMEDASGDLTTYDNSAIQTYGVNLDIKTISINISE